MVLLLPIIKRYFGTFPLIGGTTEPFCFFLIRISLSDKCARKFLISEKYATV